MTTHINQRRRTPGQSAARIAQGLGISVFLAACGTVAPKPAMPDGSTKVPVNTDDRINEFKQRMAAEQQRTGEQRRLEREFDDLRAQVTQLRTAAILLAQDAEGKSASPIPKKPSSVTPEMRTALAGVPPAAQLVIAPASPTPSAGDASAPVKQPAVLSLVPPVSKPAPIQPANSDRPAQTSTEPIKQLPVQQAAAEPAIAARGLPAPELTDPPPQASSNKTVTSGARQSGERSMIFRILQAPTATSFEAPGEITEKLIAAAKVSKQIIVRGRTQADTENEAMLKLANERAKNAREFLIANGIAAESIWVNVMGAGGFAADNSTPEGRAINSRVEIELVDLDPTPFVPTKTPQPTPALTHKPLARTNEPANDEANNKREARHE